MEEATEAQSNVLNKYLTQVESEFRVSGMPKLKQILAGLTHYSSRKIDAVKRATAERDKLFAAYQRYQELAAMLPRDEESMKISVALLLNAPLKYDPEADAYAPENREQLEREIADHEDLPLTATDLDLSQYPLWKIMREILRQVPEMRVYEVESHLERLGVKVSRMAIERAIATHHKQFAITKHGREKFVAWKEIPDAPATKYEGRGRKRK